MVTTPTPPDAVREALVGALMYGLLERDHTLANVLRVHVSEDVGLIRSAEQMADALLAVPSDARGREAIFTRRDVELLRTRADREEEAVGMMGSSHRSELRSLADRLEEHLTPAVT